MGKSTPSPARPDERTSRPASLASAALVDEFNNRLLKATEKPLDAASRVLSLPELHTRRQPPSVNAPNASNALKSSAARTFQRQRVSLSPSRAAAAPSPERDSPVAGAQAARQRLAVRPEEAARAPRRGGVAQAASPVHEGFRSPTMAMELQLAAALGDASTASPTEERAAACFAVLRGLTERASEEFRPLLSRLTLELEHAVYDTSEAEGAAHFAQLERSRAHAANLSDEVRALRAERRRWRAEAEALRTELARLDRADDADSDTESADGDGAGAGGEAAVRGAQHAGGSTVQVVDGGALGRAPPALTRRGTVKLGGLGGEFGLGARPGDEVEPIHAHLFDVRLAHAQEREAMQQAMRDMVPHEEHHALKAELATTRGRLETALEVAREHAADAGASTHELASLREERAVAVARVAELERAWTPRPRWAALSEAAAALGGAVAGAEVAGLRQGQPSRANLTAVGAALAQLWARVAELEGRLPSGACRWPAQCRWPSSHASSQRQRAPPRASRADAAGVWLLPRSRRASEAPGAGLSASARPGRARRGPAPSTRRPNEGAFFIGRGTDSSVPVHLRHHGRLRNRRLPKAEVEAHVLRVWRAKEAADAAAAAAGEAAPSLEDVFAAVAATHAADRGGAAEWCYNIVDGCRRYAFDADLELFHAVLQGAAPERAWTEQQEFLRRLRDALRAADTGAAGERGWCSAEAAAAAVDSLYPTLAAEKARQLRRLLDDAAAAAAHAGLLNYEELLAEPGEEGGDQSPFVELLREAHASEPREFLHALHALLHARDAAAHAGTLSGVVSAATVRGVVQLLDPGRPADRPVETGR